MTKLHTTQKEYDSFTNKTTINKLVSLKDWRKIANPETNHHLEILDDDSTIILKNEYSEIVDTSDNYHSLYDFLNSIEF